MSTVQLPQPPRSHISLAPPESPTAFSSVSRSVHWGSTWTFSSAPLMLSVAHWGMPLVESVLLLEVLDEGLVVEGLRPAHRAGVHEVGDGDGLGHGLLRHAEDRPDPQARHAGREARHAAGFEEVSARNASCHAPPPSTHKSC